MAFNFNILGPLVRHIVMRNSNYTFVITIGVGLESLASMFANGKTYELN